MSDETNDPNSLGGGRGLAVGVFALFAMIACCAGLPLLIVLAGSVAVGALLGVGAGVLVLVALAVLVIFRVRRRAACDSPEGQAGSAGQRRATEREVV